MVTDSYLIKRGNVYWYKRRFPSGLIEALGPSHRVSLRTKDINVARKRRDLENGRYHELVEQAQIPAKEAEVISLARQILKAKAEDTDLDEVTEEELLLDALEEYVEKHDPAFQQRDTQTALRIARAEPGTALLDDLIQDYEKALAKELTKQTTAERVGYLRKWRDSVGGSSPITALLDPDAAYGFVRETIIDTDLAKTTKQKRLQSLVLFFKWLQSRRVVKVNPFEGIELATIKGRKGSTKIDRRAWTDDEIVRLLSALENKAQSGRGMRSSRVNAQRLYDMALIAIYSGLRIDEIASLRVGDCIEAALPDGMSCPTFIIRNGKTDAAVRQVPIHPRLPTLIQSLAGKRKSGWLFEGLSPGGPDNKRSWNIQKAFGRFKTDLGFPSELVFHGLRRSFVTKMHQAGVPLMLAKRVVGHKLNDLTFGHYSEGELLSEMRGAVEKVDFGDEVIKLLEEVEGS